MSKVVEHLAELTGFRDRDVMDVTLVSALREMLDPMAVGIFRLVGDPGQERWLTRARLHADDAVATADPLWQEPDRLPAAAQHPERIDCMRERAVLKRCLGESWLTLFPLASEREAIGVLELHTNVEPRAAQLRMVGSVLRIYNNFLGLLDYSERDTLTGLLNRKTFDESFLKAAGETGTSAAAPTIEQPAQERRHVGESAGYWLGVIDIDHFKQVNDRFGHLIGDEVLLLLSRLMRSCFRFHDRLYRFGGEEFVALVRCPDEAAAVQAFERLRRTAAQYLFPQVGHISVSVGLTRVRSGDTPTTAFARADRAVYHAKNAGRNRVVSHAALIEAGLLVEQAQSSAIELF